MRPFDDSFDGRFGVCPGVYFQSDCAWGNVAGVAGILSGANPARSIPWHGQIEQAGRAR